MKTLNVNTNEKSNNICRCFEPDEWKNLINLSSKKNKRSESCSGKKLYFDFECKITSRPRNVTSLVTYRNGNKLPQKKQNSRIYCTHFCNMAKFSLRQCFIKLSSHPIRWFVCSCVLFVDFRVCFPLCAAFEPSSE